jgi:hypothetical protein
MIRISDSNSIPYISDWIEWYIAITGEFVSKTKLGQMLEKDTGEEPRESFICDIWKELEYRKKLYNICPFQIDNLAIEPNASFKPNNVYLACLIMAILGAENGSQGTSKLFERIVCEALRKYISGEAIVFGWPVIKGEKTSIRERIIDLSVKLNERYVESPAERYKDRGVDVVAWKPFLEKLPRPSQVVILLQCAAGQGWRSKTSDLPLHAWEQYIHWSCNPIKAFAVPYIIPQRDWHDVSKEGGILFDRIRIVNLICTTTGDKVLDREVTLWIKAKLREYEVC